MNSVSPRFSPWGPVQTCQRLGDGVYRVSTAGHGGWMLAASAAARLSPEARAQGEPHAAWLCFEEDEAWAVPAWEMPDLWPACFQPGGVPDPRAYLLDTLSQYRPDYLQARGVTPAPEPYARYLAWQEDERRRAARDPDLIVSCSGDWFTHLPGVYSVTTADGQSYLVTAASYDAIHRQAGALLLLSACEVVSTLTLPDPLSAI